MTMSSLYPDSLHTHQTLIQLSALWDLLEQNFHIMDVKNQFSMEQKV